MADERPIDAEQNLGSLRGCLVEGDPEQRTRERRVKRRALLASVFLQGTALIVLLLIPLFAKPERIALANITPIPPYHHVSSSNGPVTKQRPNLKHFCIACPSLPIQSLTGSTNKGVDERAPDALQGSMDGIPSVPCPTCIDIKTEGPRPPSPSQPNRPRVVHMTHIDPALLIHRVEPIYPTLMQQIRRSGRVELRAVIATDGTIQSLQVVSGDPGFYQSALNAVSQWRYKPTLLNGQPVEIDTFITVIYNVQH